MYLCNSVLSPGLLKEKETIEKSRRLKESFHKFISGIKKVISDKRVVITSNMEGLQNMTVGALEAFLPIYAVTIAGLLIARLDYLHAFWIMSGILIAALPVFAFGVRKT